MTAAPVRFSSPMTAWSIRILLGGPSVTRRKSLLDCSGFLSGISLINLYDKLIKTPPSNLTHCALACDLKLFNN